MNIFTFSDLPQEQGFLAYHRSLPEVSLLLFLFFQQTNGNNFLFKTVFVFLIK